MSAYKEIVTKAVVGKGKKYYRNTYTINTEFAPNTVLGCWVINHKFEGHEVHGKIEIDGSFDVNLWYSYDNDTKTSVMTKNIPYREVVTVSQKAEAKETKLLIILVPSKNKGNNIVPSIVLAPYSIPKTINPINKRIEEITNTIKGIGISIKLLTKIASPVLPVETTLLGI